MKHFFRKLAFVLFGALLLSACSDLDQNDNYTFSYALTYSLETDEQKEALTDYFKSKLDFDTPYTFSGSYYDATVYGCEKFREDIKVFTNKEVVGLLGEKGQAYLALHMFSSKGNLGAVSVVYWEAGMDTGEDEEQQD